MKLTNEAFCEIVFLFIPVENEDFLMSFLPHLLF